MRALNLIAIAMLAIVAGTAFAVSPARAEHMTLVSEPERGVPGEPEGGVSSLRSNDNTSRSSNLDLTLKFGLDGFRLGGRLFGERGVAGLWLNGERRPNGFVLDGRLQNEAGRAFNFKLDAEAMDAATRAAWQWLLGL